MIEVLIMFMMINLMMNLCFSLLLLDQKRDNQGIEIKEGCDIQCVIKMDIQ